MGMAVGIRRFSNHVHSRCVWHKLAVGVEINRSVQPGPFTKRTALTGNVAALGVLARALAALAAPTTLAALTIQ